MKHTSLKAALLAIPYLFAGPLACASADLRTDGLGTVTEQEDAEFSEHLHVLASEYMEGRLPGTPGIDRAADYITWQFRHIGLKPAFDNGTSYRQPFSVGSKAELEGQSMSLSMKGETKKLVSGAEFNALAYGGSGKVDLPVTFVGYSIPMGPNQYEGYPADTDLSGKAVIVLRYEPMNDEGGSRWRNDGWSYAATLGGKYRAAASRGAGAIIMVTPPGAKDAHANELESVATSEQGQPVDIPVVHVTPEVADLMIRAGDPEHRTLADLVALANEGSAIVDLQGVRASIDSEIKREPTMTNNLGAILPGKGDLADQYIVIGAHYDHLGMATFGTRFTGQMHPGADDNASGSAGMLTVAKTLSDAWKEIDGPVRSVLFLSFSAEESGLLGSQHFVEHPAVPLDKQSLMLNMDMIGSLRGHLEVGGTASAEELAELVSPIFAKSGIEVQTDVSVGSGRSDHASFDRKGVPNLFFFTGLTDQYHTPDDTPDTINYEGGAKVAHLCANVALAEAVNEGPLTFVKTNQEEDRGGRRQRMGGRGSMKIRVGIAPADYSGTDGVPIARVFPGTSAADAGLQEGDRIIVWNGEKVATVGDWMAMLASHEPGETIDIVIVRDGKEMTLPITLKAARSRGD